MASTSETGHAKNIANFQDLISFCQGYGATYNPTKESLENTPTTNSISTSQQSYDRLIDHFANLIQQLESDALTH